MTKDEKIIELIFLIAPIIEVLAAQIENKPYKELSLEIQQEILDTRNKLRKEHRIHHRTSHLIDRI